MCFDSIGKYKLIYLTIVVIVSSLPKQWPWSGLDLDAGRGLTHPRSLSPSRWRRNRLVKLLLDSNSWLQTCWPRASATFVMSRRPSRMRSRPARTRVPWRWRRCVRRQRPTKTSPRRTKPSCSHGFESLRNLLVLLWAVAAMQFSKKLLLWGLCNFEKDFIGCFDWELLSRLSCGKRK